MSCPQDSAFYQGEGHSESLKHDVAPKLTLKTMMKKLRKRTTNTSSPPKKMVEQLPEDVKVPFAEEETYVEDVVPESVLVNVAQATVGAYSLKIVLEPVPVVQSSVSDDDQTKHVSEEALSRTRYIVDPNRDHSMDRN